MIFQVLFSCIEDYNAIDDEKLDDHTKAAKDNCENKSKCTTIKYSEPELY